jgi:hypothetical protein
MICNLSPIIFFKSFTLIYFFKMQPNANLVWQNFIIAKTGCYRCKRGRGTATTPENLSNAIVVRTTLDKLGIQLIINLCNDM